MAEETRQEKKFFVPEVVQTSEMDCGPASLKALLEGFGIHTSYGRLREACQTSVDGTSIDSIEDLAVKLGLDAEQVMLPADHLLLDGLESLPALVVTRTPGGLTHFVVAWSQHYGWVQIMDPGVGRRWVRRSVFLQEVFIHTFAIPASAWRDWAGTEGFLKPLAKRMEQLHVPQEQIDELTQAASTVASWHGLAALDASIRLVEELVNTRALQPGPACAGLISALLQANLPRENQNNPVAGGFHIPQGYWSVFLVEGSDTPEGEEMLNMRGAVLVKVNGLNEKSILEENPEEAENPEALEPELAAILNESNPNVERILWEALLQDHWLVPVIIIGAFLLSSISISLQAYLLQGLFRFTTIFNGLDSQVYALGALFVFLIVLILLEIPLTDAANRVGRRLELRMRIAFLKKIPQLSDRYFHSRLASDMTSRAHGLRSLRSLPSLATGFILTSFNLLLTMCGVIWLQPESMPFALVSVFLFGVFGWFSHSALEEGDLRARTHSSALSRFYLDALQGLLPLRTHGAERAFRREHETLLTEWMRADRAMLHTGLGVEAISALLYAFFAAWVGIDYTRNSGSVGGGLLLFYWTLNLPALGQSLVRSVQSYPQIRNSLLRVLEPLSAPEETNVTGNNTANEPLSKQEVEQPGGIGISMKDVSVEAGGHLILEDVNLTISPGEHLAVVGPSGAGKSSLVGILLGWLKAAQGVCLVDGALLEGETLINLRRQTAWVDPAVQIWNRSLLDNLLYGSGDGSSLNSSFTVEDADLYQLLQRLENGLQTVLGEGGGLVSGGEGQRVRLGRAMNRSGVRLVILDEPFRGLDRAQRRKLLHKAREYWQFATLICITHDVGETLDFGRVLVIENGHVVEDNIPARLKRRKKSRYAQLLVAEEKVRSGIWESAGWRHLYMDDGQLREGK